MREPFDRFAVEQAIVSDLTPPFVSAQRAAERGQSVDWGGLQRSIDSTFEKHLTSAFVIMWLFLIDDDVSGMGLARSIAGDQANRIAKGMTANIRSDLSRGMAPASVFSQSRIETAAITETTRIVTRAQTEARKRRRDDRGQPAGPDSRDPSPLVIGDGIEVLWFTRRDERVCPICEPFHRKGREVWGSLYPAGPPDPHPRCRCELRYFDEDGNEIQFPIA